MKVLIQLIAQAAGIGTAFFLFCGLTNVASASQCVNLPERIDLSCKEGNCLNAIFWKSNPGEGNYHPNMTWSNNDGKEADLFEVIVADESGKQLPWPYPLGEGLYLSMTGSFSGTAKAKATGSSFQFELDDPTRQYGLGALATFPLASTSNASFNWDSNKGGYTMYIVNLGGNEISGKQHLNSLPKIYLVIRAVNVAGKTEITNADSKTGLLCDSKSISITSPCSFQVEPTTIRFEEISSTGPLGLVKPVKESKIYVSCIDRSNHRTYLRVTPAVRDNANEKLARFKHTDDRPFKGLALTYKVNREPQTCDDGDAWNQAQEFGKSSGKIEDKNQAGSIFWGLCRTSTPTDVGDYSTTAIIYFWVD